MTKTSVWKVNAETNCIYKGKGAFIADVSAKMSGVTRLAQPQRNENYFQSTIWVYSCISSWLATNVHDKEQVGC